MSINDAIVDSIQRKSGEIIQALLSGLKIKSYHGITIHIKSDLGFKLKLHDKKVKGKDGNKVISNIPIPIDIKIKIDPKIDIKMGGK